jgi:hypothetical protein
MRCITTPFDASMKLYPNISRPVDQLEYARVIDCLMYTMTCTRPDIAYVVGKISRYTSNPSHIHWIYVHKILKYLKKDHELWYIVPWISYSVGRIYKC